MSKDYLAAGSNNQRYLYRKLRLCSVAGCVEVWGKNFYDTPPCCGQDRCESILEEICQFSNHIMNCDGMHIPIAVYYIEDYIIIIYEYQKKRKEVYVK